jgi:Domain of unknown function (DUF4326)
MKYVVHCKRDEYDVYIGRPSKWGNPFSHLENSAALFKTGTREEAIQKYKEWILSSPKLVEEVRRELKGKVLGCWCHPLPCHGDVLAEIANKEEDEVPEETSSS